MKTYFISFADTKYKKTLERIKNEAINAKCFDHVITYSESDLDKDFVKHHGTFIAQNKRGYGYWIWKPQICLQTFNLMNDGDILIYADAGCTINKNQINVFNKYIQNTIKHDSVAIQLDNKHTEKRWCKMDTINELCMQNSNNIHTAQLVGGIFYIKKTTKNIDFVKEWLDMCTKNNYHFVDDTQSDSKNDPVFTEHRHDQAIRSLLIKKYNMYISPTQNDFRFIKDSRKKF